MSMMLSQIIRELSAGLEKHGDMPVYTPDSDIEGVQLEPTGKDGLVEEIDGVPQAPCEYCLSFIPA